MTFFVTLAEGSDAINALYVYYRYCNQIGFLLNAHTISISIRNSLTSSAILTGNTSAMLGFITIKFIASDITVIQSLLVWLRSVLLIAGRVVGWEGKAPQGAKGRQGVFSSNGQGLVDIS